MSKLTTSSFTLTGDASATLHSLMASPPEGSSDILTLSTNNYPSGPSPNQDNQHVFMNQPLSWWLEQLNAGTVKYTPVSGLVNWSYINASGSNFHIDRSVTNMIIPNKTKSVERDTVSKRTSIIFEPKYGMGRTDTYTL
jgi:hypothetical protein